MTTTKGSGRPQTIPALRLLTGTHRVDRHGDSKVVEAARFRSPSDKDLPPISETPPDWLHDDAKGYWTRLHGALVEFGFADNLDTALVAELCSLCADLERSHRILNKMIENDSEFNALVINSPTGPKANPIRREMRSLRRELMQVSALLGLTPMIRQRLMMIDNGEVDDPQVVKFFGS